MTTATGTASTGLPTLTFTDEPVRVAHVRLNRPDKLNSLTLPVLDELIALAHRIRADRTVRAVIIAGEGRSFCAGLDFASAMKKPQSLVASFVPRPWRGTNQFQEACWAFRRLPVPVIATVPRPLFRRRSPARPGCRLADHHRGRAVEHPRSEVGLIPDMSGLQSLSQQLRADVLKRLTMTGETVTGQQAVDFGLASGRGGRRGRGDRRRRSHRADRDGRQDATATDEASRR